MTDAFCDVMHSNKKGSLRRTASKLGCRKSEALNRRCHERIWQPRVLMKSSCSLTTLLSRTPCPLQLSWHLGLSRLDLLTEVSLFECGCITRHAHRATLISKNIIRLTHHWCSSFFYSQHLDMRQKIDDSRHHDGT